MNLKKFEWTWCDENLNQAYVQLNQSRGETFPGIGVHYVIAATAQVETTDSQTTLTIKSVDATDRGGFTLKVKNKSGEANQNINIKVFSYFVVVELFNWGEMCGRSELILVAFYVLLCGGHILCPTLTMYRKTSINLALCLRHLNIFFKTRASSFWWKWNLTSSEYPQAEKSFASLDSASSYHHNSVGCVK